MFCTSCGLDLGDRALKFCHQCGAPLKPLGEPSPTSPAPKAGPELTAPVPTRDTVPSHAPIEIAPAPLPAPLPAPRPSEFIPPAADARPSETASAPDTPANKPAKPKKTPHKRGRRKQRAHQQPKQPKQNAPSGNAHLPETGSPADTPADTSADASAKTENIPPSAQTPDLFGDDALVPEIGIAPDISAEISADEPAETENLPPSAQTPDLFGDDALVPETGIVSDTSADTPDIFDDARLPEIGLALDTSPDTALIPSSEVSPDDTPYFCLTGTQRPVFQDFERPPVPTRKRPGKGRFIAGGIALIALIVILGGIRWWLSSETVLQIEEVPDVIETSETPEIPLEPRLRSAPVNAGRSAPQTMPEWHPEGDADAERPLLIIPTLPSNQQQDNHNSTDVKLPESPAALPLPLPFPPPSTPRAQTGNANRSTPVLPEQPGAPVREAVLAPIKMPVPVTPAPE